VQSSVEQHRAVQSSAEQCRAEQSSTEQHHAPDTRAGTHKLSGSTPRYEENATNTVSYFEEKYRRMMLKIEYNGFDVVVKTPIKKKKKSPNHISALRVRSIFFLSHGL